VLVATAIDIVLGVALAYAPPFVNLVLFNPLLSLVISLAVPFGVGALGVFFTKQFFQQVLLSTDTIWALVVCLLVVLGVKTLLWQIPAMYLDGFSVATILLVAVGCFTASKRHWY